MSARRVEKYFNTLINYAKYTNDVTPSWVLLALVQGYLSSEHVRV